MLFYKEQFDNNGLLGIWKIEESQKQFLSFFNNMKILEKDVLSLKSESKTLERFAVRALLKELLGRETEILYHNSGKPYIVDNELNISVSHTKGYVAIILGYNNYTGIDIQYIAEKIKNIRPRFVANNEYIDSNNELSHLLLHWSAKETLYKVMGDGINLKDSFFVYPFSPETKGIIKAEERITGQNRSFDILYNVTPDFVLTYIL